jgi:excisionase family DNA binding protein
MSPTDRLSFEEAARELKISENELEQLVASGEISSIKQGDALFFKRSAVDSFKKKAPTSDQQILLTDDELNLLEDEGEVDFGIDLDAAAEGTTPVTEEAAPKTPPRPAKGARGKTERLDVPVDDAFELPEISLETDAEKTGVLSSDDTVLNLGGILEEEAEGTTPVSSAAPAAKKAAGRKKAPSKPAEVTAGLGDETLLDTDLLDLGEDADAFELDTTEDTLLDATEEGTLLRGGGARVMQMKRKESHLAFTVLLLLTGLVLLLPLSVLCSFVFLERPASEIVSDRPGARSYEWIENFGGVFRDNLVGPIADMFRGD